MLFGTQTINSRGHLEIGGCDTVELAQSFGTPLYVMDEALLRQNCRDYQESFRKRYPNSEIAFAGKAFLNTAMCRILDQEGMSLDCVSAGELYTALKARFPFERIYFHGNNKSEGEIAMALDKGVGRIVVDNMRELEILNSLAVAEGKQAEILLRLTPGIDPHTHRLIRTGQADTKFGMNIKDGTAIQAVKRALECPGVTLKGIHCHVGSQLFDLQAHTGAVHIFVEFLRDVQAETGFVLEEVNTGGGLGVMYVETDRPPTIDEFAETLVSTFLRCLNEFKLDWQPKLIQEPGRSLVCTAGTTLYTIGTIKTVPITEAPGSRTYVAVDGGLSDNPRPSLYQAVYTPLVANKANAEATEVVTISGKHCETDTLIAQTRIAPVEPGDILAVLSTGAYNYSMSSNYNRLARPAVVLVADGQADVIVKRETLEDIVKNDVIPSRLR
mgnify:CR=1 FL=1